MTNLNGTHFTAAIEGPAEPPTSALYFAFHNLELLVHDTQPVATVPTLEEMDADQSRPAHLHFLGYRQTEDGTQACYAANLPEDFTPPSGTALIGLRQFFGRSDDGLFQIAGRAVQIVEWDRTHQFCSRCGSPTQDQQHDRARICPNCGLTSYPRLAPAVIVRVQRTAPDGKCQILLARNGRYRGSMYSVLAGFVEPGETLEECVQRELWEEVGINVTNIAYFGSQPWPFPHSLMIAFTADYLDGDLVVDKVELEEAYWFSADSMPNTPPPPSISNRLIQDWISQNPS